MFQRILVPLDGSARAEQAIPLAARLARSHNGTVVLLRAVNLIPEYASYAVLPASLSTSMLDVDREQATAYLYHVATSTWLDGVATETDVPIGPAASEILAAVATHSVDAVLLCSHGRTGMTRWLMGSIADHVARHAPVPVLVLPEHDAFAQPAPQDPEHQPRILVALDGSSRAEAALEPAAALAAALDDVGNGALHLALVITPIETMPDNMPEGLIMDGANSYLKRIANRLRVHHALLRVTWTVAIDGDIAAGLLGVAEGDHTVVEADAVRGCSVIAMATHGRSGFALWGLGSTTERVLHATHTPMLIVRSGELNRSESSSETASGRGQTQQLVGAYNAPRAGVDAPHHSS